jgi:hypothetical protein
MRGKIMIELTKNSRLLAAPVEQIFFNHNHPRRIITKSDKAGRLADVDAWLIFKNLVPEYRKMLLDGSEMITLQACAQIQTKPLKSKKLVKTENGGAIMDEKPSKTCLNTGRIDLHEAGGG